MNHLRNFDKFVNFKFLNFLTEQEGFVDVVKEVWDNGIKGKTIWRLLNKLKKFSLDISKWSKECIGDVIEVVKQKEEHNMLIEKKCMN